MNLLEQLKNILQKIGLEEFSTHQLRHTYATRSIEAGMSPVVLQKLMGHTDVSVTLNAYTSVFDKYKKAELEKVNQYYIEQNLLKPQSDKNIYLKDGTNLIDAKSFDEEDEDF